MKFKKKTLTSDQDRRPLPTHCDDLGPDVVSVKVFLQFQQPETIWLLGKQCCQPYITKTMRRRVTRNVRLFYERASYLRVNMK